MAEHDTPQEIGAVSQLGNVLAEGEGGYNSYNTGTLHGRVQHSGTKPLYSMTVDQILESSKLSPTDHRRVFAAGKYQVITNTLRSAKAELGLSGKELFTGELQEKIFLHYLLGKKRPKIGLYITKGVGSVLDAVYQAAMEWASVEVPAGMTMQRGTKSNGHLSYYESSANHAKQGSGAKVKAALEHARQVYAAVERGEEPQEPERLPTTIGDEDEPPREAAGEATPATPGETKPEKPGTPARHTDGHLIHGSVGLRGHNDEADVGAVQQALMDHGHSPGVIDHVMGAATISAIRSFQAGFMPHPDGLVEVGKTTEHHLRDASTKNPPKEAAQQVDPRDAELEQDLREDPIGQIERRPADHRATEPRTTQPAKPTDGTLADLMAEPRLSPEQIAKARALIANEPKTNRPGLYRQLQEKVVYANQRDNQATLHGKKVETGHGEMCNLTSLAMCLEYLGIPNPHPEMQYEDALERVRQEHHFHARTTPEGWSAVARACGAKVNMLSWNGTHDRNYWKKVVGGAVSSGESVMASITGHIVRIQGIDEDGLVVDDPYGKRALKPGGKKAWKIIQNNAKNSSGKAGEDNLWTWDQVERHSFLWIAAFSR